MNNDDMDEAFKKAADEYELNEQLAADWNGVHSALHQHSTRVAQPAKEKKRRRFLIFWWLLLLPAALFIMYESGLFSAGLKDKHTDKKANNTTVKQAANSAQAGIKKDNAEAGKDDVEHKAADVEKMNDGNTNAAANANAEKEDQHDGSSIALLKKQNYLILNNAKPAETSAINKATHIADATPFTTDNSINAQQKNSVIGSNQQKPDSIADNKNNTALSINEQSIKTHHDSTQNPAAKNKKISIDNYVRQAYKYAGISTNADVSFIDGQKTSGIGFGAGIIAGYHFKNGISIEAGAFYNKKNYYTKGAYFNKSKLNDYLQSSEILESEGNCKMWELPLNVRYDFNTRKKYNWYVTTGVSSYLMNKEYYYFTYKKDGDLRHHGYDYKRSSKDWFSVLNIGGGVSIKTGDKYLLQLQPYYKLPLKGVGIGSLSLNSTGVNINLVRRFK